jgi:diguanylate cyclase (GGDEF)-like protein
LVDLDGFGSVNEQHGSLIGDRILHRVGQLLAEAAGPADLVARYAGQRFALVLADSGPRAAIKGLELFRQTLERTTFRHEDKKIRLTACGAVTEAQSDDAYDQVFARLEEALKQAKQAGPNRSVSADRGGTEPIESPNLGAKYVEITV